MAGNMGPSLQLFYEGYDPGWILGKDKGPPVETKPKPPAAAAAKNQPPAPIELKVPFCCEECERRMSSHLIQQEGVESVKLDGNGKVTVTGKVKPDDCLKAAKKIVKRTEFWPKKKDDGAKKDDPKKKGDAPAPAKKEEKKDEKKEEKKEAPAAKKDEKKDAPAAAAAPKKDGPPPPTELKVCICCEGCAARLYTALRNVDDVTDVNINHTTGKVTVHGKAKPEKVMKAAKKVKPAAELIVAKKK